MQHGHHHDYHNAKCSLVRRSYASPWNDHRELWWFPASVSLSVWLPQNWGSPRAASHLRGRNSDAVTVVLGSKDIPTELWESHVHMRAGCSLKGNRLRQAKSVGCTLVLDWRLLSILSWRLDCPSSTWHVSLLAHMHLHYICSELTREHFIDIAIFVTMWWYCRHLK